jgi:hypothetical protein
MVGGRQLGTTISALRRANVPVVANWEGKGEESDTIYKACELERGLLAPILNNEEECPPE